MTDKIYDLLPAHLQNKELETIFDATIERMFSKGKIEKVKSFVGRKEKGIMSENDSYLSFPQHLFNRDNYGLEPVFSNSSLKDNVYYDDLLNALFNKGCLVNDHRRLFKSQTETVSLPIDADKFVNYSLYYWVRPGFFENIGKTEKHYVTIDRIGMDYTGGNWWSNNNAWYHYDDIREYITEDNKHLVEQAIRPIIEFDGKLDLAEVHTGDKVTSWTIPLFKVESIDSNYSEDVPIFNYVQDENFVIDNELGFRPKVKSGDYLSEYVFEINIPLDTYWTIDGIRSDLYIECEFEYRNLRHEVGFGTHAFVDLPQMAKDANSVDVYIDGIKQITGYDYIESNGVSSINFPEDVEGNLYIDYSTKENVVIDGDKTWQRVDPVVEYNIDNDDHNFVELTYSTVYEHLIRMIETTPGLTGEANASNNFRNLSDDKTTFNKYGSVLVKNSIDIKRAYFAMTRDDYNPIDAVEFLASSYQGYKDKFVTTVRELLKETASDTKSNETILTEAIRLISKSKRSSINVFVGTEMINLGDENAHYITGEIVIDSLTSGVNQVFIPDNLVDEIDINTSLYVYKNDKILKNNIDFSFGSSEETWITVKEDTVDGDVYKFRYFLRTEETFIPPSAVKFNVAPYYIPRVIADYKYGQQQDFILGHDGAMVPAWGDRTDEILLMFELMVYNKLDKEQLSTEIKMKQFGLYKDADVDYTFNEKKYIMYPFFRRWMTRNNISDLYNTDFDPNNWKTWNYRAIDDDAPGHWRGIHEYIYGTDNITEQPWVAVGLSVDDGSFGGDTNTYNYWEQLKEKYNASWPNPYNIDNSFKPPNQLVFNNQIDFSTIELMKQDWEFGDGSPVEMAWKRSSEYPFYEFLLSVLTRPFKILDEYSVQINDMIRYHHKREGLNTDSVISTINGYEFKLGSKLGGFVNNFKLMSENSALSNSNNTQIPSDNYELLVHAGEPNRSESFSAIVLEKVSLDKSYPVYDPLDIYDYNLGDIVYNNRDKKYYRRKATEVTEKEEQQLINFDYSAWVLISQPKVREFGYRIHGYDDINPVFYALAWDKTTDKKVWKSEGEFAHLKDWQSGNFYRNDTYVKYQNKPYVSLDEHTSSSSFEGDIENWKQLREWPRTNLVEANGYDGTTTDTVLSFNYGDVLKTVDDVAQLFIGYQDYLKAVGWDFTDINEDGQLVDYENLLSKFLEWSSETHVPGDFITITPVLTSGRFKVPYGIASFSKDKVKNAYRIVDSAGRKIPEKQIKVYSDIDGITWSTEQPIYGLKIDILDVEHAFVVDREDSYGDVIYDPLNHNRNLRMIVECNRTEDWDGTMNVDGYILYGDKLVPNLETLTEETLYYRDTIVDHSLEILNSIKSAQIGYSPRNYLANHQVERESQVEFYKGFLANKGADTSINRIVNFNSDFKDITKKDIWAFKLSEYGRTGGKKTKTVEVDVSNIFSDPYELDFAENIFTPQIFNTKHQLKTVGYVDSKDVNYIVRNVNVLENSSKTFYEGDTAWIRFDEEREWDVQRLSEISELKYVSETEDGQLSIALRNEIEIDKPVYLKIDNVDIDPVIGGYYNVVDDGTSQIDGVTVYEYLVYDLEYEPVIVEIDTSTSNSVFVPTSDNSGVEAISAISNPTFSEGDEIYINYKVDDDGSVTGHKFTYTADGSVGAGTLVIGGLSATPDPIISEGEQGRIIFYDENGSIINQDSVITFGGTVLSADTILFSQIGDEFTILNQTITVEESDTFTINPVSNANQDTELDDADTLTIATNNGTNDFNSRPVEVIGTVANPELSSAGLLVINGVTVRLALPAIIPVADTTESQTVSAPVSSVTLSSDMTNHTPGDITVDNGVDSPYTLTNGSDYSYDTTTQEITFNTPIVDGVTDHDSDPLTPDQGNGNVDLTIQLVGVDIQPPITLDMIVDTINNDFPVTAIASKHTDSGNEYLKLVEGTSRLTMAGPMLTLLGLSTGGSYDVSKLEQLADDIDAVTGISASIVSDVLEINVDSTITQMTLSGDLATTLDFNKTTWVTSTDPTVQSVVNQINALNISGLSAEVVAGKLKVSANQPDLTISASSAVVLQRLGFTTNDMSVSTDSVASIVASIQDVIPAGTTVSSDNSGRVSITTDAASVVISNLTGNPWDDLGIIPGPYNNVSTVSNSMVVFRDIINADEQNDVTVSISSDGRMIFTSPLSSLSFARTPQTVLDKVGLYEEYTSVTSNTNFKIMRWKSVRYTPYYNGETTKDFLTDLGLNDTSYIWLDVNDGTEPRKDEGGGMDNKAVYGNWAVVERNQVGDYVLKAQQAKSINTDLVHRTMVTDNSGTWWNYQLYDPLNMKFSGEIIRDIDYVSWNDPAKYDEYLSDGLWLDEKLGEIWWDTNNARYYRYNDYGNADGDIDIGYVKRHWGKQVPGSEVVIKQWVMNEKLPRGIKWFNTKKFWDDARQSTVVKYFYWTTLGDEPRNNKKYSINQTRTMLQSGGNIKNKFLPVDEHTMVISNNTEVFERETLNIEVQYSDSKEDITKKMHSEWKLMSKESTSKIDNEFLVDLKHSLMGKTVSEYIEYEISDADVVDNTFSKYFIDEEGKSVLSGLTKKNIIVSIDNRFVNASYIDRESLVTGTLKIYNSEDYVNAVMRVYVLENYNNWFTDINEARRTFAYIMNEHFYNTMLIKKYPHYKDYIQKDEYMFSSSTWFLNDDYKEIETYQYLSKSRDIDMLSLVEDGVNSFKIELRTEDNILKSQNDKVDEDTDEYYFKVGEVLRLVNKTNSTVSLSYTDVIVPDRIDPDANEQETDEFVSYYENIFAVQTYELLNMMYEYADTKFIKHMFFEMIDYMYTEKTYPDWLFKTSYIDVVLYNKPLRQYAIYQRDTEQDAIDYINETKPYHTKIRTLDRIYTTSDDVSANVDIDEQLYITLEFGNGYSRYDSDVIFGNDDNENVINPIYPRTPITSKSFTNGFFEESDDWDAYDQGALLQRSTVYTSVAGGFDTGEMSARILESMILKIKTVDTTEFHIYDKFGRANVSKTRASDVVTSFDGETLVIDNDDIFRQAKAETKHFVAIEKETGEVEFMLYNDKDGNNLAISDRALFNGLSVDIEQGDKIYVF